MRIVRAETAGFCMGVGLALKKLDRLLEEHDGKDPVAMLGPIIHNPQVLEQYAARGVVLARTIEEVPADGYVIIRAHGIPRRDEQSLRERGVTIVDATCPKVKKAQLLIAEQAELGKTLLLYGEADHPEVKGLLSHAPKHHIFEDLDALRRIELDPGETYFLAAQTTQDKRHFAEIETHLRETVDADLHVLRTICDATRQRQDEAIRLAGETDFMIVVGGKSSGNTRRLASVIEAAGTPCLHVETVDELSTQALPDCETVGLTAGASTPGEIIDAVETYLNAL